MIRLPKLGLSAPLLLALSSSALQACGAPTSQPPSEIAGVPRQTLVQALAELRAAALRSPDWQLDRAVRDSILAAFGLSEETLLGVAEAGGGDLDLMVQLWQEVDSALRVKRAETVPGLDGNAAHHRGEAGRPETRPDFSPIPPAEGRVVGKAQRILSPRTRSSYPSRSLARKT